MCHAPRQLSDDFQFCRLPELQFQSLAFRNIENKADGLIVRPRHRHQADQDGHSTPIFTKVFFLPSRYFSCALEFSQRLFILLLPVRGSHVRHLQFACDQMLSCLANHLQEGIICIQHDPLRVHHDDPNEIGFNKALKPRFAGLKLIHCPHPCRIRTEESPSIPPNENHKDDDIRNGKERQSEGGVIKARLLPHHSQPPENERYQDCRRK